MIYRSSRKERTKLRTRKKDLFDNQRSFDAFSISSNMVSFYLILPSFANPFLETVCDIAYQLNINESITITDLF